MTFQSSNSILTYFQDLLESNKLSVLKTTAMEKFQEQYGTLIETIDLENGIITYSKIFYDQATDGPIEAIVTYSFAEEFTSEVLTQAQTAKHTIDSTVTEINKAGNNATEFITSQAKDLSFLIERAKVLYPKIKFIETELLDLLNYLVEKYSLTESYKKQSRINISKSSFFDIKTSVRRPQLVKLYDTAIDLDIFDDEKVSEETFINVLSGNPSNTDEVLIFNCNNLLAIHFIQGIQPLFKNLSHSQIAKSKSFINKQGKIFKQADLDTSSTRLKTKTSLEIDRITNHLSKIIKT